MFNLTTPNPRSIIEEAGRNLGWNVADWLAPCDWLSLFSGAAQDHLPRGFIFPSGQSLIQRMPPMDLPIGNLMEAYSQLRLLFSDDSRLCQIDKQTNKNRTRGHCATYKSQGYLGCLRITI